MPFMMRLTSDGVALHSGYIAEKPSSHGCIRLPKEFARRLFETANCGDEVTVIHDSQNILLPNQAFSNSVISASKQPFIASESLFAKTATVPISQSVSGESSIQPVKSMTQLEDEELEIRKDPSLTSATRMQKLRTIWAEQILLAKKLTIKTFLSTNN
jgi:hypothetical protein